QIRDHAELEQEGRQIDDGEHQQAEHDLERARTDQKPEQRVQDVRDDEHLEQIAPARSGKRQLPDGHYGAPSADANASASRAAATSCNRYMRAPRSQASTQAAAVALSRASAGWPG